jgi:hypothetical protein
MLPVKYQGDDIFYSIAIKDDAGEYINLSTEFLNVLAYIYTNKNNILKYSKNTITGIYSIQVITDKLYVIKLESGLTSNMSPGNIMMEIKVVKSNSDLSDGKEDTIQKVIIAKLETSEINSFDGVYNTIASIDGKDYETLSSLILTNVNTSNSNNGLLYWTIDFYYQDYVLKAYKNAAKTVQVLESEFFKKTGSYLIRGISNSNISGFLEVVINFKLYWSIVTYQTSYKLRLYKDADKLNQVAETPSINTSGIYAINGLFNSGITGTLVAKLTYKIYWSIVQYQTSFYLRLYKDYAKTILIGESEPFSDTGTYEINPYWSTSQGALTIADNINVTSDTDSSNYFLLRNGVVTKVGDANNQIEAITLPESTTSYLEAYRNVDSDSDNEIVINSLDPDDISISGDDDYFIDSMSLSNINTLNSKSFVDKDSLNIITVTL